MKRDNAVSEQQQKKIMKSSHASQGGKTLINRIEAQMDRQRAKIEKHIEKHGLVAQDCPLALEKGRYQGLAASLAVLRSTKLSEEIERSNERLGIE